MSVDEILEELPALSVEERARVKALLDTLPDQPLSAEDRAKRTLMRAGLLSRRQPRPARAASNNSTPIEIKGSPLSKTIIEERR
jgi:hypothetical protein